jgi:hypothetical protein
MSGGPRYRFGPLERRGLVAGWRGGQIVSVAVGLVVAVAALRDRAGPPGVVVALVAAVGGLAVACWPVAGRTAEEWVPTVARWCTVGLAGRRRQRVAIPAAGRCSGPHPAGCGAPCRGALVRSRSRSVYGGLRIVEVAAAGRAVPGDGAVPADRTVPADGGGGGAAVVVDHRAGTVTAVLRVAGRSFALLGAEEQDRQVSGWASVLASLARERPTVRRLQWVASSLPDDGRAVHDDLARRAVLDERSPAQRSYRQLLGLLATGTCRHEVLLAVQVRGRPARRSGVDDPLAAALAREVDALRRLLGDTDVEVAGVLGRDELAATFRAARLPGALDEPAAAVDGDHPFERRAPVVAGGRPCAAAWPWPLAVRTYWDRVQADGVWQTIYWVAEWPRVDVSPDFLAPLLLGSVRRTVSMVMEPLSPSRAIRQVERARTADLADSELRRRGGFLATARRNREAELVVRREAELADGHASFRFSGYVTVRAATSAALDEACEATEQAAGQAHLELRRLYGDQDRALLHGLPLCTGLA